MMEKVKKKRSGWINAALTRVRHRWEIRDQSGIKIDVTFWQNDNKMKNPKTLISNW